MRHRPTDAPAASTHEYRSGDEPEGYAARFPAPLADADNPGGDGERVTYTDRAHALTSDLGFASSSCLTFFAAARAPWWGNPHGDRMFAGTGAFDHAGEKPTLADVARHGRAVANTTPVRTARRRDGA